ncbi:uncharacterized protein LOC133785195 [Humulus lupulus]|uniref:uncharacterized protein LOC133785195 n=1 Tax=Humulus lupulus TaxID=3486 RepID=UPI002B4185D4|nr:uncharacterized protein LOC133785195 [Humulus lupulus]
MKQRANRRRSSVRPSHVADGPVSPPTEVTAPSPVVASMPSAVATSPGRVVSPALDPSLAMDIVPIPPTVPESSPSPPSSSLPEVVTASVPPVSPSVNVLHARLPCSVGKSSSPDSVSSPKRVTHSSVVSVSSPGESPPLPNPNPPSASLLKSPSMCKQSLPKTPKTRFASKPKPKPTPKPHVPVQSKGKESKCVFSPKDSVSFVDPSSIQYFVDATKASHYQSWFAVRDLWPEYSVVLEDFPDLVELLQSRHWVNTVSKLVSPHPILIREFYANLDRSVLDGQNDDCLTAFVRGSRVKFAPSTIARALKIPKGNHDIPVTKLTIFYRVLHRPALYNWFPNSHLSSVTLEIGKFLYVVGTGVSIDLATLIYDQIFYVASSTSTRNKLPYPILIQQIIKPAEPSLTTHDFQVANPILPKKFLEALNKKLYTEFKAFTTHYKKDQKRQMAFEASMYKLVQVVKTLVVQSEYGSQLSPLIDVSPPAFHRDSFGESSMAPESSILIQEEFTSPTQVPPVSSTVPPADTELDTSVSPTLPDALP